MSKLRHRQAKCLVTLLVNWNVKRQVSWSGRGQGQGIAIRKAALQMNRSIWELRAGPWGEQSLRAAQTKVMLN